jgi:hypothetical protein
LSQPKPYVPAHAFVSDSATLAGFPGQALDVEFQDVKTTTDAIRTNLALIQRDDGALKNGVVTYDALSASLQSAGLQPATPWVTATAYQAGASVIQTTSLYRCLVAHTSGVFAPDLAAGKWLFLATLPSGTNGVNGNGYGGTSSTSLTIANGAPKIFQTQSGLAYLVGDYVRAKSTANGNNFMEGLVSSYSGTSLTIAVAAIGGSGTFADWQFNQSGSPGSPSGVTTLNGQGGALANYSSPCGRLTLTSGTPVMASSVAAATTVYWTPDGGDLLPLFDGTFMIPTQFPEVSQATTDAAKSPAAVGASKVYDLFAWNDGGTKRVTRGPAWTNDTTRGYTLTVTNGIQLNTSAITNGPGALRGTWVGTIRSNGSSTIDYIFGAAGVGGVAAFFGVWNAYNRRFVTTMVSDTTGSWTYAVASTWRAANGSATARVTMVRGADEDGITARYNAEGSAGATTSLVAGVGLDGTTAFSGTTELNTALNSPLHGEYAGLPGLGVHFVAPIEYNTTTTASTWYGNVAAYAQTGFIVGLWT